MSRPRDQKPAGPQSSPTRGEFLGMRLQDKEARRFRAYAAGVGVPLGAALVRLMDRCGVETKVSELETPGPEPALDAGRERGTDPP